MSDPVVGFANGTMITYPQGGGHWSVRLQYLLWLKEAGYPFYWFERLGHKRPAKRQEHLDQFTQRIREWGLDEFVYVWESDPDDKAPSPDRIRCLNHPQEQFRAAWERTEVLFNFCCSMPRSLVSTFPRTALLDLDPGHLQVSELMYDMGFDEYDALFTVGLNMGSATCEAPTRGRPWRPFVPPIHLPTWDPGTQPADDAPYSSMTHWAWEVLDWGDRRISLSKRDAYLQHIRLPEFCRAPIELAVNLWRNGDDGDDDGALLERHGWRLVHPYDVATTPQEYREFIASRRGEIGCAKPIHTELKTGWLSDRTVAFLAAGRPAVVVETGISEHVPTGDGLLTFETTEEAADAIHRIEADYAHHCEAARAFAEAHCDAGRIIPRMIEIAVHEPTQRGSANG